MSRRLLWSGLVLVACWSTASAQIVKRAPILRFIEAEVPLPDHWIWQQAILVDVPEVVEIVSTDVEESSLSPEERVKRRRELAQAFEEIAVTEEEPEEDDPSADFAAYLERVSQIEKAIEVEAPELEDPMALPTESSEDEEETLAEDELAPAISAAP